MTIRLVPTLLSLLLVCSQATLPQQRHVPQILDDDDEDHRLLRKGRKKSNKNNKYVNTYAAAKSGKKGGGSNDQIYNFIDYVSNFKAKKSGKKKQRRKPSCRPNPCALGETCRDGICYCQHPRMWQDGICQLPIMPCHDCNKPGEMCVMGLCVCQPDFVLMNGICVKKDQVSTPVPTTLVPTPSPIPLITPAPMTTTPEPTLPANTFSPTQAPILSATTSTPTTEPVSLPPATVLPDTVLPTAASLPNWIQIGLDLDGTAPNDFRGATLALSSDGTILAVGSYGSIAFTGQVQVYQRSAGSSTSSSSGTEWIPQGLVLEGQAAGGAFGSSVALSSDGSVVAIGAPVAARVQVLEWSGTAWVQRGTDMEGEEADNQFGTAVSISSDGTIVAVGAPTNDGVNGVDSGLVRVYEWTGSDWSQRGQDLGGEAAEDRSGRTIYLSSDGSIVAVGARRNDGNGMDAGQVRVYEYTGTQWLQRGSDIDGEAAEDQSGWAVSLSGQGTILAVGAWLNDGNGSFSGQVRVFEWNGSEWSQLGSDLDGESLEDQSGYSVSLSNDGTILAIGAIWNDGNGQDSGSVRVYKWSGSEWSQLGNDIDGEAPGDYSGSSVAISSDGTILAVGAPQNDENGENAGQVRVYEYNE